MQALGINAGNLFVNVCCFVLAFLIITKFIVGPVQNILEKRKAETEKGLADAKAAAEARANSEVEKAAILEQARSEAAEILENARKEAESRKADLLNEARQRLSQQEQDILAKAEKEREAMLSEMRPQIVELVMGCTEKIVGDSLVGKDDAQRQMIDKLISGLEAGTEADLKALGKDVSKLDITTAIPLTDAEKQQLTAVWKKQSGRDLSPYFTVDPAILGGMKLRTDNVLLDLSVSGKLADLRRNMAN